MNISNPRHSVNTFIIQNQRFMQKFNNFTKQNKIFFSKLYKPYNTGFILYKKGKSVTHFNMKVFHLALFPEHPETFA